MQQGCINALAVLSLILALATGGLWVRSYWIEDALLRGDGFALVSDHGQIYRIWAGWKLSDPRRWVWRINDRWSPYPTRGLPGNPFPHWPLGAAFLLLPTLRGWQLLRAHKRQHENLCLNCGYDLRATPDRCPECGKEVATAAPSRGA